MQEEQQEYGECNYTGEKMGGARTEQASKKEKSDADDRRPPPSPLLVGETPLRHRRGGGEQGDSEKERRRRTGLGTMCTCAPAGRSYQTTDRDMHIYMYAQTSNKSLTSALSSPPPSRSYAQTGAREAKTSTTRDLFVRRVACVCGGVRMRNGCLVGCVRETK